MQLKSYFDGRSKTRGWTNQEIAEFYRVSDILSRSGLLIAVDQGLTDEGTRGWSFEKRQATSLRTSHVQLTIHGSKFIGQPPLSG